MSAPADSLALASALPMTHALLESDRELSTDRRESAGPAVGLIRVLHVINGEHYSGAERVQDLLAEALPDLGFEVGFACVKPGRFPEARRYRDARLYEMPM